MMWAYTAVLLWMGALYRGYVMVRTRDFVTATYFTAAALVAAAATVRLFEAWISAAWGPYIGDLLKTVLVVGVCVALELMVRALRKATVSRRFLLARLGLAGLVTAGLIVTFVVAPIHHIKNAVDLEQVSHIPAVALNILLFNSYLAYVLIDNFFFYRRNVNTAGTNEVDLGSQVSFRLLEWGVLFGAAYAVAHLIYAVGRSVFDRQWAVLEPGGSAAAVVSLMLIALGMTAPRSAPWLERWLAAARGLRRQTPIWRDLRVVLPRASLSTLPALTPALATYRLERRVVESGQALRVARIAPETADSVKHAADPISRLAEVMAETRSSWATTQSGVQASSLLPSATTDSTWREQMLALADRYRSKKVTMRKRLFARIVTEVSGPAVVVIAGIVVVTWRNAVNAAAVTWGAVAILLCACLPMAYVVRGVRAGKWVDHHIPDRDNRSVPLLVGFGSMAAALLLLLAEKAPSELTSLIVAHIAGLTVIIVITRFWKVSVHAASSGALVGLLLALYGAWALFGLLALALVMWSRTVLDAHTWAQVTVGASVGLTVMMAVFTGLR